MIYRKPFIGLLVMMLGVVLPSCSLRALREALDVVSQADSLRHEGQMFRDSAALAESYTTLTKWQRFYPDDYAHCCYHYGRLLREKDDPVAAMEVFINATHSHTDDLHILGRVYSNMGDICHLAGDFPLSYDMFERSTNMFLQGGDTLLYYYGLNNMAYELAEQGKRKETSAVLLQIEQLCADENVRLEAMAAKARLYLKINQYDSVIYTVNNLLSKRKNYASNYVLKAQAFWHLEQRDSAIYYAKYVMTLPDVTKQEKYNMLYIVFNGDSTLDAEKIKELSEQRADLETKLLVPLHKKYAVASNTLRQDIKRNPRYVYIVSIFIAVAGLIFFLVLYSAKIRKEKTRQENILHDIKQQRLSHYHDKRGEIEQFFITIQTSQSWQTEITWKDYNSLCHFMDKHCFAIARKLKERGALNEREIRLCILVLIGGFSDKQMADILCYAENSIRGIKRYTAQKLGTSSAKLRDFLLNMVLNLSV